MACLPLTRHFVVLTVFAVFPFMVNRANLVAETPGPQDSGKLHVDHTNQHPTVLMLIAEREYGTKETLTKFAAEELASGYRVISVFEDAEKENHFVGLEQLEQADVLLISVRRKTLPAEQLSIIRRYVASGKPVIGIRTANHAFCLRNKPAPDGLVDWPEFDRDVFGGNYSNHHGRDLPSSIDGIPGANGNPLIKDVQTPFRQGGTLYIVSPIAKNAVPVLVGRAEGVADEPVAWEFTRGGGGYSFYTSLGHAEDFMQPGFRNLLRNAIGKALHSPQPPR